MDLYFVTEYNGHFFYKFFNLFIRDHDRHICESAQKAKHLVDEILFLLLAQSRFSAEIALKSLIIKKSKTKSHFISTTML